MKNLKDFALEIPHLWEKENEILDAISNSDGVEKQLLIFQSRAANMLKQINNFEATPEKIAWLSIWTKTFSALEGVRAALFRNSQFMLEIISRVVLEGMLHVEVICEPKFSLYKAVSSYHKVEISKRSESYALKQVINRLQAYTAWCLWNDKQYYKEILDRRTLNGIWDPNPAKELLANLDDKEKLVLYEEIFGPYAVEIETDRSKLKEGRKKMEESFQEKLRRVDAWSCDPSLQHWKEKLEELQEENIGTIPFFALFDESVNSISKRLKRVDMRFAYSKYMKGSMLIHSSTVNQLFIIVENKIFPRFTGTDKDSESAADFVGSICNRIFVLLNVLQKYVWNEQIC